MDFAALKQSLSDVFSRMQDKTQAGDLPDLADAEQFVRLSRLMQAQAEDEWAEEAEDFSHLAQQLLQAVKKSLVEDSIMLVESLDDAQNYCHRTYQD